MQFTSEFSPEQDVSLKLMPISWRKRIRQNHCSEALSSPEYIEVLHTRLQSSTEIVLFMPGLQVGRVPVLVQHLKTRQTMIITLVLKSESRQTRSRDAMRRMQDESVWGRDRVCLVSPKLSRVNALANRDADVMILFLQ